jgi:hypothetical protein
MAELVDALVSGTSVHKTWGFESLYPHHFLAGGAGKKMVVENKQAPGLSRFDPFSVRD